MVELEPVELCEPRRDRRVVELLLPVVLCPVVSVLVLLGELIWSLPVVDWPVALVPVWPAGFAEVGEVGSVVVPAVGGGALDGIVDGDDDCAYANAPPARTVLSAIELILSNFVELIVIPHWGGNPLAF